MKEDGHCVAVATVVAIVGIALVLLLKQVGKGECEDSLNLKKSNNKDRCGRSGSTDLPDLLQNTYFLPQLCPVKGGSTLSPPTLMPSGEILRSKVDIMAVNGYC